MIQARAGPASGAGGRRQCENRGRQQLVCATNEVLCARCDGHWAMCSRTAQADGTALLHELGRFEVCQKRMTRRAR